MWTCPAVGAISPAAMWRSVDFPQPVGPTMATNSPSATESDVLLIAGYATLSAKRKVTAMSRSAIAGAPARILIPAAVHQRPLLDPRHHGTQLGADLLDRMRSHSRPHRLERTRIDPVSPPPVAGGDAALDVGE